MANEEQTERIRIVNLMYTRIEKMDKELDDTIKAYAKKTYKKRQQSKMFEFTNVAELPAEEAKEGSSPTPIKFGIWTRKGAATQDFRGSPERAGEDELSMTEGMLVEDSSPRTSP